MSNSSAKLKAMVSSGDSCSAKHSVLGPDATCHCDRVPEPPVQGVAKQLSQAPHFRIGTSGWTYDDWRDSFYPREIPKRRWLAWYAAQFTCSEINGSFYRTPSLETVQAWHDSTPANFLFAWKASKFITHWKRLSNASKNSIELLVSRLVVLGPKCGPVLFQLPGRFMADRERL